MIRRWLVRGRERAGREWLQCAREARLLAPTPLSTNAYAAVRRARRRLRLWDALLDLWTANGTR